MSEWRLYRKAGVTQMRPYQDGEDLTGVSISAEDKKNGSPKAGDMIARDLKNPADVWLVSKEYHAANYQPAGGGT